MGEVLGVSREIRLETLNRPFRYGGGDQSNEPLCLPQRDGLIQVGERGRP